MKIKPFKLLGKILLGAAPVVAGAVAGPGAGIAVAGLMGTLGLTKKAGQKIEEKGVKIAGKVLMEPGYRPQKVAVPALALVLPALLAPLIPADVMDKIQVAACQICEDPDAIVRIALSIFGGGTVLWHTISKGVEKLAGQTEK